MSRLGAASIIGAFLVTAGCKAELHDCQAASRFMEPAHHYWHQPPPIVISTGEVTTVMPQAGYMVYVPDTYYFAIKGRDKGGDVVERQIEVDKSAYDSFYEGQPSDCHN